MIIVQEIFKVQYMIQQKSIDMNWFDVESHTSKEKAFISIKAWKLRFHPDYHTFKVIKRVTLIEESDVS